MKFRTALIAGVLCLWPDVSAAQTLSLEVEGLLEIDGLPVTFGDLDPEVVVQELQPSLPAIAACFEDEDPAPIHLRFDETGVPSVLGRPPLPLDCLHTALARVRVGTAPAGSRRTALVRWVPTERRVETPTLMPEAVQIETPTLVPEAIRNEPDGPDVSLILGLSLGGGVLVGGAMMWGSISLEGFAQDALRYFGLALAAPGLVVLAFAWLIDGAGSD